MDILRLRAKLVGHKGDELLADAFNCASPTGVCRTDGSLLGIKEQQGNTVGGEHPYASPWHVGDDTVDTFQPSFPFLFAKVEISLVNMAEVGLMYLMLTDDMVSVDA